MILRDCKSYKAALSLKIICSCYSPDWEVLRKRNKATSAGIWNFAKASALPETNITPETDAWKMILSFLGPSFIASHLPSTTFTPADGPPGNPRRSGSVENPAANRDFSTPNGPSKLEPSSLWWETPVKSWRFWTWWSDASLMVQKSRRFPTTWHVYIYIHKSL